MDKRRGSWRRELFVRLWPLSRHNSRAAECPLLGVKRTSMWRVFTSAFDSKRTCPKSML